MNKRVITWLIVIMAAVNYGFMVFDGVRGLVVGDYLRPSSGEYAGKLGPWSNLVQTTGMDPESSSMKVLFILWGVAGLFVTGCFLKRMKWSWNGMLLISISSLWYLVPGTLLSILQMILLFAIRLSWQRTTMQKE